MGVESGLNEQPSLLINVKALRNNKKAQRMNSMRKEFVKQSRIYFGSNCHSRVHTLNRSDVPPSCWWIEGRRTNVV